MDFIAAELAFRGLEQMRKTGRIDMAQYRQHLMALGVTDDQGRTWRMQELTGQWFVWEGAQWQVATPPRPAAPSSLPPPAAPPQPQPVTAQPLANPVVSPAMAPPVAQQSAPLTVCAPGQSVQQAPAAGSAPTSRQVKYWRPSCLSVTLRLIFWALFWSAVAWAVSSLIRATPLWAYAAVLAGAVLHLVYTVRRLTRHGRKARADAMGGAR